MTRELRAVGDAVPAPYASAAKLATLEEVVRWPGTIVEVIVQDEFTHDVIVAADDGDGFLVFDTT